MQTSGNLFPLYSYVYPTMLFKILHLSALKKQKEHTNASYAPHL
ncbi:hypothetical protein I33_2358 [Bacillus subtilis subsp. subtilis str. RO-NN-1]|nr:hypothetical protein I33_2358 [Bacillus subtilis subsp. subtilis str. RO-NN-1]